jgi:predicted methyltransferase
VLQHRQLHVGTLTSIEPELQRMNEFKRASNLEAEDRQSAAADSIKQSLDFLQYAPPQFTLATRLKLAQLYRGLRDFIIALLSNDCNRKRSDNAKVHCIMA